MKELKNGQGATVVFAFDEEPGRSAISKFVNYERDSIFSFYMEDDVDKMYLVDNDSFTDPVGQTSQELSDWDFKEWNLEITLDTYQELVDMGINDNVLIKILRNRSRPWQYWMNYFDITDASEEDIAIILMRWKGIIYGREEN